MSATTNKPKMFSELSHLEIWLSIGVPVAIFLGFVVWADTQTIERRVLGGGVTVLQENQVVLAVSMPLCVVLTLIGLAVLLRKPWRRLALAGTLCLGIGLLFGAVYIPLPALRDVITFTPTGATISAPWWLGSAPRTRLVYSDIEWLGTRERSHWETSWNPRHFIMQWLDGGTPGWRQVEVVERLVKVRGSEPAMVTFGWPLKGAWREITGAASAAAVTVKPIDRIAQPRPTK